MTAVAKTRAGPRRSARQGVNVAWRLKEIESNEEYHGAERLPDRLAGLQGESIDDDDS